MRRSVLALCLIAAATPAAAQQLTVRFAQGQVSVDAVGVPARAILDEWSRVGGTKVVNGERIAGAPLTLKLVNVPEAQALEIILRNVAGYVAAPRGAAAGASAYDRIVVMPATVAAAARPVGTPAPPGAMAGAQQRPAPPRFVPPTPEEGAQEDAAEDQPPAGPPVFTFPQGGQPTRPGQMPVFRPPNNTGPQPADAPPQVAPAVGAPVPGMVVQPVRPGQSRPPGS